MKIVLSIPSGFRKEGLANVILKWRKVCNFKIVVYTWDKETVRFVSHLADSICIGDFKSYACNHNFLARTIIKDWDVYICGADDLYPGFGIENIEIICKRYPDKILWVRDGFLNQQITHPIITRGWYEKYNEIFDEKFKHNFCDTDLLVRALAKNEIIKCFDISFDHRHYLKTGKKKDEIYRIGESSYAEDRKYFNEKHKDKNININNVPEVKV